MGEQAKIRRPTQRQTRIDSNQSLVDLSERDHGGRPSALLIRRGSCISFNGFERETLSFSLLKDVLLHAELGYADEGFIPF